jgi:hypothetical protein
VSVHARRCGHDDTKARCSFSPLQHRPLEPRVERQMRECRVLGIRQAPLKLAAMAFTLRNWLDRYFPPRRQ